MRLNHWRDLWAGRTSWLNRKSRRALGRKGRSEPATIRGNLARTVESLENRSLLSSVSATVNGGALHVVVPDGFEPQEGQTFQFTDFGANDSTGGLFSGATGLYGFGDGSAYFEIEQTAEELTLVTHGLPGGSLLQLVTDSNNDTLGRFFNSDYFGYGTFSVTASLSVSDFFHVSGSLALQSSSETVKLANGTVVQVDAWRIGGENLDLFAGVNGPYFVDSDGDGDIDANDTPNSSAVGVSFQDADFALALLSPRPNQPTVAGLSWTTLQTTAGGVAFVGNPELGLSSTDLRVTLNQVSGVATAVNPATQVVDFAATPLVVKTGPTTNFSLNLAGSQGELLRASGDNVALNVAGFFQVNGSLAFETSASQVTLTNGDHVAVSLLTVGATDLNAFAGLNSGSADALGLSLTNVDFALAIASEQTAPSQPARQWAALAATAESVQFLGGSDLAVSGSHLAVELNLTASDNSVIDFLAQPLEILTGSTTTQTLSMDGSLGELIRVSGTLDIAVGDFVQFTGDVAFEKSRRNEVSLAAGRTVDLDQLIVATNGVSAFVGNSGGTDNAIGFNLAEVDLALVLSSDAAQPDHKWISLQAEARTVEFVGLPSITASGTDLSVTFNQALSGENVIDFTASPQLVTTGPGSSVTLEMPGSVGNLSRATGHIDLAVAGFFSVSGDFGFEQSIRTVKLSDGSEIAVDLLSLGASDADVFIGLNGGSENAIGFEATGVHFGFVLATDRADDDREFLLLQATVASAAFSGGDGLSIAVGDMSLTIADTEDSDLVLDFSDTPLVIATGASSVTLDFDGAQREIVQVAAHADLDIFGFVQVSGDFAFKKSAGAITLTDDSKVEADFLAIGATGADAFIGLNGGTDGALGFAATDVELHLCQRARLRLAVKQNRGVLAVTSVIAPVQGLLI